jgi:hypothetical protein
LRISNLLYPPAFFASQSKTQFAENAEPGGAINHWRISMLPPVNSLRFISPAVVMQESLKEIAGTRLPRYQ